MIKRIVLILLTLTFFNTSVSQTNLEQKKAKLLQYTGSERVDLLLTLSEEMVEEKPTQGLEWALEAIELSYELKLKEKLGKSFKLVGMCHEDLEDFEKAIEYYLKALKIFKETGNLQEEGICWNYAGYIYWYMKHFEKARQYFFNSIEAAQKVKNENLLARNYNHIGLCFAEEEQSKEALQFFQKSLKLYEKNNDLKGIPVVKTNIGYTYLKSEDYKTALIYLQESLKLHQNRFPEKKFAITEILNYLGKSYLFTGKFASAEEAIRKARKMAVKINSNYLLNENNLIFSQYYYESGDYKKSLEYYREWNKLKDKIFPAVKTYNIAAKESAANRILQNENNLFSSVKLHLLNNLFLIIIFIGASILIIIYLYKKNKKKADTAPKYKSSKISAGLKSEILIKLDETFNEKKYYRNKDASINNLAGELKINRSYLSQVINEEYKKSFNNVINEMRIKEAAALLTQEENKQYTIEHIANVVGFSSTTAFNRAFKSTFSCSPTQYIKDQKASVKTDSGK
ncbi:MAG: tetratricopeptide repeat protein [Rhodothermaceae bacterium]